MGSKEEPLPSSSISNSSPEPALVRFTEALTETPDAAKAAGIADMLLIFLSGGGTILGGMSAAMVYLFSTASHAHTAPWIFMLLVSVGAGGLLGCLVVMLILNAKNLITWETGTERSK